MKKTGEMAEVTATDTTPPKRTVEIDLTDCLLKHMDISVSESEKRSNSAINLRDCYTVYLIETRINDNGWELIEHGLGQIWRRYSEFEQLRTYLCSVYPWAVIPPLPEKRQTFPGSGLPGDTFDPDFVDRRRVGLENFLHRIAQHPSVSRDSMFLVFLQQEEGWRQSIQEKGLVELAEDKFKAINAVVRTRESDPDFDLIRKYINGIQPVLTNILRIRAKAALKIHNIHKLSSGYGKTFSEWSAIEKEMGDGLQRAGHFFDSIASSNETFLEDEEQIIDQLKEYHYYASSLESICIRRDMMQHEIEQFKDNIKSKETEIERIQQGKHGVLSRLLGSVETIERQNGKIDNLTEQINSLKEKVLEKEDLLSDFKDKALKDIEHFHKMKVTDLKQTLELYIKHQIKMAKRGVQTWENIKDCINSIPS